MSKKSRDISKGTKEYEEVCTTCKDVIRTYPVISWRTDYKDEEIEERTLKQTICTLQAKEQKLEKIKNYCNTCNLKADFTACDILKMIEE